MSRPGTDRLQRGFALIVFAFLAAAFGGWIYEVICVYLLYHTFYNRGMLHLTICPIYGFGAWGLYLLLHKVKNTALYFLLSVLIASGFEYACALLLEHIFHRIYWTYEGWPLSVQNRISLVSSLIFGVLAVIFAKCIVPPIKKVVSRGKARNWFLAAIGVICVILADFAIVVKGMQS